MRAMARVRHARRVGSSHQHGVARSIGRVTSTTHNDKGNVMDIDRNHAALVKIATDAGVHPIFLEGFIDVEVIEFRLSFGNTTVEVELAVQVARTAWDWSDWDDDADMTNCLRLRAWSMKVAQIGFDTYFNQRTTHLMGFDKQPPALPLSLPLS